MTNTNKPMNAFTLPAFREIPDVGLYLEQVVKYINGFFAQFPEMTVTTSMVSNYVKSKMISSPHRKTYSREQIAALLFIVAAKTVLSMDHIRMCLNERNLFENDAEAYDTFAKMLMNATQSSPEDKNDNNEELRTLRRITVAVANKMYLERYFDEKKEKA